MADGDRFEVRLTFDLSCCCIGCSSDERVNLSSSSVVGFRNVPSRDIRFVFEASVSVSVPVDILSELSSLLGSFSKQFRRAGSFSKLSFGRDK